MKLSLLRYDIILGMASYYLYTSLIGTVAVQLHMSIVLKIFHRVCIPALFIALLFTLSEYHAFNGIAKNQPY